MKHLLTHPLSLRALHCLAMAKAYLRYRNPRRRGVGRQHAARRATEMRELVETARASGVEPIALEGARELHDQLAAIDYDALSASTVQSLIEFLANEGFLASLATVGGGQRSSLESKDV